MTTPHKGPKPRNLFPFDDVIMWEYAAGVGTSQELCTHPLFIGLAIIVKLNHTLQGYLTGTSGTMLFRVAPIALGLWYDCPIISEVIPRWKAWVKCGGGTMHNKIVGCMYALWDFSMNNGSDTAVWVDLVHVLIWNKFWCIWCHAFVEIYGVTNTGSTNIGFPLKARF